MYVEAGEVTVVPKTTVTHTPKPGSLPHPQRAPGRLIYSSLLIDGDSHHQTRLNTAENSVNKWRLDHIAMLAIRDSYGGFDGRRLRGVPPDP